MYNVYLDKMLCPIAPEKISFKIKNKNKTLMLINEGEINVLKDAGLTEISFTLLLPNQKYPFAVYKSGYKQASYFLGEIEKLKTSKKPFQFIVTRTKPSGAKLFNTNITVSLEDYEFADDVKDGVDVKVKIKLKQFREYGTKIVKVQTANNKTSAAVKSQPRSTVNSPAPKNQSKKYTVVAGDCLWTIAKKFYGDGSKWEKICKANPNVCGKPYKSGGTTYVMIRAGDVLTIPI